MFLARLSTALKEMLPRSRLAATHRLNTVEAEEGSMAPIDAYLQGPQPGYALLLAGEWGVGKSFFWWKYKSRVARFNLTPITMSAAGLQSSEDLERSLFQASISGLGNSAVREAGTIIGRALLRLAKVDPDDIRLKADATGGKTVICIDDIERFAGEFKVLFGFIVNLIDSGVHCILLADEDRAREFASYNKYKERIVGKTIQLEPDPRSFSEVTIRGFASAKSREVLLANLDGILDIIEHRDVRNLRTVRFLLTEADGVLRRLPDGPAKSEGVTTLLNALSFYVIATTKSAENIELVAKAFSTAELGVVLALSDQRVEGDEEGNVIARLLALLKETKFSEEAYAWPESRAFVNLVKGRAVDFADLATDFGLIQQEPLLAMDSLTAINQYRQLSDHDLQHHIDTLSNQVRRLEILDLSRLFEAYRALYWMAKSGIFGISPEAWTIEMITAVGRYDPATITSDDVDFWMGPYDENERRVIETIESLAAKVVAIKKTAQNETERREIINGEGPLPDATSHPVFFDQDPETIFSDLMINGQRSTLRMQQFFRQRMRVMNSPDYVGDDRDFADGLASLIEDRVPFNPPLTIADSLILDLAKVLRKFVDFVDAYKRGRAR